MRLNNIIVLLGIVGASFSFSRGIPMIGLIFVLIIIAGLLMNPPIEIEDAE
jgi:ABC-type amino acid transport system permease subunit